MERPTSWKIWLGVLLLALGVETLVMESMGVHTRPYRPSVLTLLVGGAVWAAALSGLALVLSAYGVDRSVRPGAWGHRIAVGFWVALAVLTVLLCASAITQTTIAVLFWFVFFLAYILADAIVNAQFARCVLRAYALVIVPVLVIELVMTVAPLAQPIHNPSGLAALIALAVVAAVASAVVVAVTRAVRFFSRWLTAQTPLT